MEKKSIDKEIEKELVWHHFRLLYVFIDKTSHSLRTFL